VPSAHHAWPADDAAVPASAVLKIPCADRPPLPMSARRTRLRGRIPMLPIDRPRSCKTPAQHIRPARAWLPRYRFGMAVFPVAYNGWFLAPWVRAAILVVHLAEKDPGSARLEMPRLEVG